MVAVSGAWQGRGHERCDSTRPDPKARLTHDDILAAGLDDWRKVLNRLKARFRTGDFATGVALVDRIGAAADEADHHPDVQLTYPEVIVTLSSHDVGGITSRDLDLARRISGFAAELGAEADTSGLTQLEPGLDTEAPQHLGAFYAALLGGEVNDQGEPVDPSGQVPGLWFQKRASGVSPTSRRRTTSSAGTSTSGCRTTRGSDGSRQCSTRAVGWSATPRRRRSGSSRTPTATGPASAPRSTAGDG